MKEYKPFKMKRSPFKVFPAIAALLAKLGVTAAGGKAITAAALKAGAGKIAGKAATSIATNAAMNVLKPKGQKEFEKINAMNNFANMRFGTGSSFTMKRNMKK